MGSEGEILMIKHNYYVRRLDGFSIYQDNLEAARKLAHSMSKLGPAPIIIYREEVATQVFLLERWIDGEKEDDQ